MTPFQITIEITEATQCHHAVSQLLRVFPKLRLTITVQDETIPTPARPSQACNSDNRCGHCRECIALRRAIDAIRTLGYAFRRATACSGGVGANSNAKGTRAETNLDADAAALTAARCSTPADSAAASYAWKPGEHTEAAAEARNGRDNLGHKASDDSAYQ